MSDHRQTADGQAARLRLLTLAIVLALAAPVAAGDRDADRFAASIGNAASVVRCEADHASRLIVCVAQMDARRIELFTGALVENSKQQGGWHLHGRTLVLEGWTWVMVNFEGHGVEHEFGSADKSKVVKPR